MRKRINRAAVCSSENYSTSKRLHLSMLEEKHSHFKSMTIKGDVPVLKGDVVTSKFKTIRVFGKNMRVTIDEYNTYCKEFCL